MAQVELRTRQEGDEVGTQTEINGGQFAGQTPVMCPVGAQFFVRNLFYNVPARRRFLDKSTTSAAQIKAEFQRVALCNPHIAFELYANDAPVYTLCATSLAGRIVDVVGRHIKQNLLEVDADTSIACIEGYIGRPAAAKRRNGEQYLFVNGRYFKSSYLTSAIMKAYEKLIPESSSPSYFLYLTIDPSRIDVNVHPQKTEVKFADEEAVWQIINAAVRETLAKTGAVPLMDFDRDGIVEIPALSKGAVYSEPRAMSNGDYNPFREEYIDPTAPDPNVDFTGFDVPYDDRGQTLYEDYLKMLGNGSSVSQQLLFPERLVLSGDEYALLEENAVEFASLGFDIDFAGEGTIEVKGTPADMPADAVDQMVYDLLQAFSTPVSLADQRPRRYPYQTGIIRWKNVLL